MKNGCASRTLSRARSSYAEVKPAIDEVNETNKDTELQTNNISVIQCLCIYITPN